MGKLSDVYYFWGSEHYLIDQEIKRIAGELQNATGEPPEVVCLEADELSPGQLIEAMDFSSLFNLNRLLVIKRPAWLVKSRKKKARSEEYLQVLEYYLQQPSQGQIVVITGEELPPGPFGKMLGKMSTVIHFARPESGELTAWLQAEFRKEGKEVPINLLKTIANSGQDMYYLKNLVDKLCLMHAGRLTMADIEEELSSGEEIRVFRLSDALLRRDLVSAISAYDQLLSQGGSESFFLYIIVQQFTQMAKVKSYQDEGMSSREIESALGLKGWAVRSKSEQSGHFNWEEIGSLFDFFLETDIRLKTTSQIPRIVFEELIVRVCSGR